MFLVPPLSEIGEVIPWAPQERNRHAQRRSCASVHQVAEEN